MDALRREDQQRSLAKDICLFWGINKSFTWAREDERPEIIEPMAK